MSDATNALVTGQPRSGKTTALERTASRLREDGYAVGGLSSPERREASRRVGFDIVDVASGERAVLAAIKLDATDGFLDAVKNRSDTKRFAVEPDARDALPETLAAWIRSRIRPRESIGPNSDPNLVFSWRVTVPPDRDRRSGRARDRGATEPRDR